MASDFVSRGDKPSLDLGSEFRLLASTLVRCATELAQRRPHSIRQGLRILLLTLVALIAGIAARKMVIVTMAVMLSADRLLHGGALG